VNCPLCSHHEEEEMHLLFESEASKEAWGVAGLEHIINPRVQKFLQQQRSYLTFVVMKIKV
jgi:hypothetical protein